MPRALRIEFPGALYHVMARGQRRDVIVRDDRDREMFLATLAEAVKRFGWEFFGYVLMRNHYHLLLATPGANLVSGMKWFQTTFATRFRVRHRLNGSVFGGRYKAQLIERDDRHFGTVLDYIHLNPWRAGLVTLEEGLENYRWSSVPAYAIARRLRPTWLDASEGLRWMGFRDTSIGRKSFLERLEQRARTGTRRGDQETRAELAWIAVLRRGWCFGTQTFREAMIRQAAALLGRQRDPAQVETMVRRDVSLAEAARLLESACARWKITIEELRTRPKGDPQKVALARIVRSRTSASLRWLTEQMNLGVIPAVSRLLGRYQRPNDLSKLERRIFADLTAMLK